MANATSLKKEQQQVPVSTGPRPSLIRRILGSGADSQNWPELENEFARMERQFPNEAAKARIIPMGPLQRMRTPDAYAATGPLGTIALNRDLIEKEKQNLGDVLSHELAHVGQGGGGFLRGMYDLQSVENEAVNKEAMRVMPKKRDIYLRPENPGMIKTSPSMNVMNKLGRK